MTGEQLRRLRDRCGVTLRLLDAATGIGVPNISRLEHGRRKISPNMEKRIRAALKRIRGGKLCAVPRLSVRQAKAVLSGGGN